MKILPPLAFLLLAFTSQGQTLPATAPQVLIGGTDAKVEKQPEEAVRDLVVGLERVRFFDGSDLRGSMISLDNNRNLFWRHESSSDPIRFKFRAVESLVLDRTLPDEADGLRNQLKIHLGNGDKLRCNFKRLEKDRLVVETGFANRIFIPLDKLRRMEFLPSTHEILYDSTEGLSKWKSSNRKSWTSEEGSLVSVFSGSTGTILPRKDALEVEFDAQWERSFYLAIRFFSDSDGASYGNTGYHLSFSNNRLNLQANKRVKGRITRETLGSTTISELTTKKSGRFSVFAHRERKEFIIRLNDREIARWKDASEDFFPDGNGILFINQGGNSYMRLKELSITGWNGKFFPLASKSRDDDSANAIVTFSNGDSTEITEGTGESDVFSLRTKRGDFEVPLERMRSLAFPSGEEEEMDTSEQVFLNRSLGRLSFDLKAIDDKTLTGTHPSFGEFTIPLTVIKKMSCNRTLKKIRQYLDQLSKARESLDQRRPDLAVTSLNEANPSYRGWYWGRLMLLSANMQSREVLSFAPHPEKGLTKVAFAGNSETVLSTGKDGNYALWNGHAKLADGEFNDPASFPIEIGRFSNEEQKVVTISRPFWLGETEVTQEQYELLMNKNPSTRKEPNLPVEVSWNDAQAFCRKLGQTEKPPAGYEWRLPTEAEWEYACRAGSTGPYSGSSAGQLEPDEASYARHLGKFGWFSQNSSGQTHPVRGKKPNGFGLYDMHGNVWEWCMDSVKRNKTSFMNDRKSGLVDPYSGEGEWRALRGGNFEVPYSRCRSAYRGANAPNVTQSDRGFRLALAPILNEEGNASALPKPEDLKIENLSLSMIAIPKGSFLMGSPSSLTAPRAITDSSGDSLLTGSGRGVLGKTDFSGKPVIALYEFNASISALSSLSDPELALAGCLDGSAHLYDIEAKRLVKSFRDHRFPVTSVVFSPKGDVFATSGLDGSINLYEREGLALKWSFSGADQGIGVDAIEFSGDGKLLLASAQGSAPVLVDAGEGKMIRILDIGIGGFVASHFHPDGKSVVSVTEKGQLVFVNVPSGVAYNLIRLNLSGVRDFSFSPHGKRIIVSNEEGICSIRDFPDKGTIVVKPPQGELETTPDYFFAMTIEGKASMGSLSDFMQERNLNYGPDAAPAGCAYSPDGKWFVTAVDGALRLWRSETDGWVATLAENLAAPVTDCAFSPDGSYVVAKLQTGHLLAYPSGTGEKTPNAIKSGKQLEAWLKGEDQR